MPVLEAIRKSGVDDVCVVVTRYFGGILLGAGGLVRAYSHSAVIAINEAEIVTYEPYCEYSLSCGYSEYQKYSNILGIEKAVIDSTDFGAEVTVRFAVKKTQAERILTKISESGFGRDVPQLCGERFDCR
jgi:putative IMPACT (imprinted ancient) family translation regulator